MLLPRGAPQPDLLLSGLGELGPCPQGGLAIPRGKISTVIGAMQDVELHELHGVMHMGRTPTFEATHGGVAQGGGGGRRGGYIEARTKACSEGGG